MFTKTKRPTRIGYNPFYFLYNSDHRAMFIDIPIKHHFQLQPMVSSTAREIGSKSKHIEKFIDKVYDHLEQNKVFNKEEQYTQTMCKDV